MTTTQSNHSEPLTIERRFNATVDQVWQALTDVNALRQWYFQLKDFSPEAGFEFQFVVEQDGNVYDHRCKVAEVIPLQKLSYSWRYHGHEGDSLVTIELFPEDGGTRLKLTHAGLETFPKMAAFARGNFVEGWTQIIGSSLKNHLEPAAHKLTIRREFSAPLELVWKTWTEPAHVSQWLGDDQDMTVESVQMDVRTGGKFRIQQRMKDGEYYTAAGTYLEVSPHERLVQTWDWEKEGGGTEPGELEGNETRVTVEFEALGPHTQVVLTHEKFATARSRDSHETGWTRWLEKMGKFMDA